jgi:photosystem II stability/assembly factor-like uncharacterized protein
MKTLLKYTVIFLFLSSIQISLSLSSYWVPQVSGVTFQLDKVHFINSQTGIAIGPSSVLLRTSNGGANWVSINTGIPSGFYAIRFKDINTVYTFAFSTLYKSTNGGINWASVINIGHSISSIVIFGETIILPSSADIYKSTNNGINWISYAAPASGGYGYFFLNENTGWSIGAQYFPPPNPGSNMNNRIYKTVNGGMNWSNILTQVSQVQPMFESIAFCDENTGYIAGLYGTRKSTNGGNGWSIIGQGLSWDIFPFNKDTLWLITGGASVYVSMNGGANWNFDSVGTRLNDICFLDRNTAWAVGDNGKIFISRTAVTGLSNQNENIPDDFYLLQNYPNPFNPLTRIKYGVKSNSHVEIKVYDLMGRSITTLVNKRHIGGVYEVDFNASGYSSGFFFYRLQVDGITVNTKKMMLIK